MTETFAGNKHFPQGTPENPIIEVIDSQLTRDEALRRNPDFFIPEEVYERQTVVDVIYFSFDGKYHQGQIVVDKELQKDIEDFFNFLLKQKFPIHKAVPVADPLIDFNDAVSMAQNNSSGFNPRVIKNSNPPRPSNHAFGRAIDINPWNNPVVYLKDNNRTEPEGAVYVMGAPGTLTAEMIKFLTDRGWNWGGNYNDLKDYHHFDKLLKK